MKISTRYYVNLFSWVPIWVPKNFRHELRDNIMADFEIRNGFAKTKELQSCSMDDDLRHSLWNLHEELFDEIFPNYQSESDKKALNSLLAFYWTDFFKQPISNFSLAYYIAQRRSDKQTSLDI